MKKKKITMKQLTVDYATKEKQQHDNTVASMSKVHRSRKRKVKGEQKRIMKEYYENYF